MSEKPKYPRGKYPRTRKEGKTVSLWMPKEFPLKSPETREIVLKVWKSGFTVDELLELTKTPKLFTAFMKGEDALDTFFESNEDLHTLWTRLTT